MPQQAFGASECAAGKFATATKGNMIAAIESISSNLDPSPSRSFFVLLSRSLKVATIPPFKARFKAPDDRRYLILERLR